MSFQDDLNRTQEYDNKYSNILDLFARAPAMRGQKDLPKLFAKAYKEDKLLALKILFWLRDCRGGAGERQLFKDCLTYLANNDSKALIANLHLVPEYGRWDDLLILLDNHKMKKEVLKLCKKQLYKDLKAEHPSLLAKWMPSENASSIETKLNAKLFISYLGVSPRIYRKILSRLRKKIDILETKLCEMNYDAIDYSSIPSQASIHYRKAFIRNDGERYQSFLDSVNSGETKINTATLYPYQIIHNIWNNMYCSNIEEQALETMWDNLPDYVEGKNLNMMIALDTSGSMMSGYNPSVSPLDLGISLAMYCAERMTGPYKNKFINFSEKPMLINIHGDSLKDKITNIYNAPVNYSSTNVDATFDLILNTAKEYNLRQEDIPDRVAIISDMQFNGSTTNCDFSKISAKFERAGYKMPRLIFWNVNDSGKPMAMYGNNEVQLVGGASPTLFKAVLNDEFKSAYDLMLDVIDTDRYSAITLS